MIFTKKLMVDSNSGELWVAHNTLKKAGVHSSVTTLRNKTGYGDNRDCALAAKYGMTTRAIDPSENLTYVLRVYRWDVKKAKDILKLA